MISAVEGVQPQTRVLMRTLQRLRIPALLFVNKMMTQYVGQALREGPRGWQVTDCTVGATQVAIGSVSPGVDPGADRR